MKTKIYINGIGSISAQEIKELFEEKVIRYNQNIIPAVSPDFKKHIPAMQLRRMSKGIKMGLTAAKTALEDADVEVPDVVITGTGQGSKIDTEKFLQEMLDREEETLSPTSFIQSTHNTIGGQIALNLACKGYNMTYSQNSASLESALIDSLLFLQEDSENTVLVGGVDEISEKITSFQVLDGQVKSEAIDNLQLLNSSTPGTIISEGAHFLTISAESTANSYAELVDVSVVNSEDPKTVSEKIQQFLLKNNRSLKQI
ncbi:beta-ketoacyl synthase chain length factor [Antarcticibacterium sp. 1MA-6-2]|uniref:beta-ketoacyl synthase chain length factor n=1 Tax=Antarcticibacterium sp. 1MA-6-2 TaxID=2908210 RepID=UPI001F46ACCC|nr:beta-ketoacyl synthase chain length factor [Antarcticibacterium sp. 1MA-6-2]UJH91644.1 beta-ketoacyl synthase chain length factor [Antarcticibacterium sp. 1MA-6-2]